MMPQLLFLLFLGIVSTVHNTPVGVDCSTSDWTSLQREVDQLTKKYSTFWGFTVGINDDITYKDDYINDPIVFNDLREMVAGGYNLSSGQFKAPVHGIYTFHLTAVRRGCKDCNMYAGIVTPDRGTSTAVAVVTDEEPWSLSVVSEMQAGELAYAKIWGTKNKPTLAGRYVYFSGALVNQL